MKNNLILGQLVRKHSEIKATDVNLSLKDNKRIYMFLHMFPRSLKDQKCCSCIALHRILRAEHDEPKKMVCRAKASRATVKCSVCKSGLTAVPSEIFRVKGCMSPQPIYSVENFIAVAKMLTPHPLPFFFSFCFTYFLNCTI